MKTYKTAWKEVTALQNTYKSKSVIIIIGDTHITLRPGQWLVMTPTGKNTILSNEQFTTIYQE